VPASSNRVSPSLQGETRKGIRATMFNALERRPRMRFEVAQIARRHAPTCIVGTVTFA
jgi:hypothetical protein